MSNQNGEIRVCSLFCGVGGFDLGLNRVSKQFKVVYANDIDKYAGEVYKKRFPETEFFGGDIRTVDVDRIPSFDLLCGGFPCQAFSIAGKRKGFDDTRGTLFFEIARIIKAKRPKIVLLENVRGLLSHEAGRTFGRIIEVLGDLGYWVEWEVLNSKNFGVPQNRERVFLVGHLRGESSRKIFPLGESPEKNSGAHSETVYAITSTYHKRGLYVMPLKTNTKLGYDLAEKGDGIRLQFEKSETARGRVVKGKSQSLQTSGQVGTLIGNRIRRLTPKECERLQGFPDDWTEYGKVFNNVRLIGNIWEETNAQLENVKDKQLLENHAYVLNTTKDGKNGEILKQNILLKEKIKENVQYKAVIEKLTAENYVCDTINHGKDTVMLYNLKGTSKIETLTQNNLIKEKMEEPNIYPLWKISLEENLNKKKLSTILTLIKKTILKKTFTCAKTGKNITNAIIHWNKSELNFSKKDILDLEMEDIIPISDNQRYKCMGNAVTVNVVQAIGEKIAEANS